MNLKTTFALLILVGGCVYLFWKGPELTYAPKTDGVDSGTIKELTSWTPKSINGIDILIDGKSTLKIQSPDFDKPLELVGNWPIRRAEVDELVQTLTSLKSRFQAIPIQSGQDLTSYGLAESQKPIEVQLRVNGQPHTLLLGQPAPQKGDNPFAEPTYLQLDNKPELIRLGPDVISVFRKNEDHYRRRLLFPEVVRLRVTDEAEPKLSSEDPPSTKSIPLLSDAVTSIHIEGPGGSYTLKRVAKLPEEKTLPDRPQGDAFVTPLQISESWELVEPVKDRIDPAKLKNILSGIADLWVDRFFTLPDLATQVGTLYSGAISGLFQADFPGIAGLKSENDTHLNPDLQKAADLTFSGAGLLIHKSDFAKKITLRFEDGTSRTLSIGKIMESKKRFEPPPMIPGAPPIPPREISEDLRIARLGTNPFICVIKADKIKDVFFTLDVDPTATVTKALDELRDAKLLHVDASQVSKIEVNRPNKPSLVLERTKKGDAKSESEEKKRDRWDLLMPFKGLAENTPINDFLKPFESLSASKEDILPSEQAKDLTALGLDPNQATKVALTIDGKSKTLWLGKKDFLKNKVYAKVEGSNRVNLVDTDVLNQIDKNPRVYRALKLFDLGENRVETVSVQKGSETFSLQEIPGLTTKWHLTTAVKTEADSGKVNQLARDLGNLQATEFVYDPLSAEERQASTLLLSSLAQGANPTTADQYGLEQPSLKVTLHFAGPKTLADQSLWIGKKREGKEEYFARLGSSPSIFAINQTVVETLNKGSLGLLPMDITNGTSDAITFIEVRKGMESPYTLSQVEKKWKLTAPIDASVDNNLVQSLANNLAALRVERYEAHATQDLAKYGLNNPILRVKFGMKEKKPFAGEPDKEQVKDRVLLIGQPEAADKQNRFAKLEGDENPAIFVISEAAFKSADLSMLDLLEKKLLALNTAFVSKIESKTPEGSLTLAREKTSWKVEGAAIPLDQPTIDSLLSRLKDLSAQKYADYGKQVDLAKYGLDSGSKPATVVAWLDKESHKIELGKLVDPKSSESGRYARVDDGFGIAILSPTVSEDLSRSKLDFVERTLLKFDPIELQSITRGMNGQELELKQSASGSWEIGKPLNKPADQDNLEDLSARLGRLRAERIVAVDEKDLGKYGLEKPTAQLTFDLLDRNAKEYKRILKIGKAIDDKKPDGDRYVMSEGSSMIGVLSSPIAKRLLAEPLKYRDRKLAGFVNADKIVLTEGERQITFQKGPSAWKVEKPLEADTEDESLRELHDTLARLRADEIVADKPANLVEYGLDKPTSIWKLYSGNQEVLNLLIGKRDSTGFRSYAKLGNSDLIVLLDMSLSAKLASEYRKRSLWESLPADQITEVSLQNGKKSAKFTKGPADWIDATNPSEKVKQDAIRDLIDVMSSLKAEHFVRDTGANFATYGLTPDKATTITVATATGGSRTIVVGNLQDGKRYFAKLEDPTRTDVFVLSETDTKRLPRSKEAFLVNPAKPRDDREVLPKPKDSRESLPKPRELKK